jgi:adenine-specific DNA-methyltransferase
MVRRKESEGMSGSAPAIERLRTQAANRPREEKEQLGQFLTPAPVAAQVASLFRPLPSSINHLKLLDPGAGVGALSRAFVEWLVRQEHHPKSIEIVAVELDESLIPLLAETLESCKGIAAAAEISTSMNVVHANFLELCGDQTDLFSSEALLKDFTHVIMNPPYRKINSDSDERRLLSQNGIEVSNIYAGFVALASRLLTDGGELSAITPRSFCNGTYFKDFRRQFFSSMALEAAHVFVSRKKAFAEDSVLQENVIFAARKTLTRPDVVSIHSSDGPNAALTENRVPYTTVLPAHEREMVIHLPADEVGMRAMEFVTALPARLSELGLTVSTGPVVDFRARHDLFADVKENTVPLLYPAHFTPNGIEWPTQSRKPNAIADSPRTAWSLVPVGNYVLTKRFTSKEEKKRIVARILECSQFSAHPRIGLENHLNFFHTGGQGLDMDLCFGLAAYLNSTVVDVYFRQFNGHTQVNAGDLRMMRYPELAALQRLGAAVQEDRAAAYQQERIDQLMRQIVGA